MQGLSSMPRTVSISERHSLIGGEIIGSLPAGMTMEERRSIRDSVPMSPSLSLLGSLGHVRPTSCLSDT
jgi:hypothetical protein